MREGFVVSLFASILIVPLAAPRCARAEWPPFGRPLCTAPGAQLGPSITTDGAGGAIVTWLDRRNFPFNIDAQHVLSSGVVDGAWPINGRALLTDALIQTIVPQGTEAPVIAPDGAGGAIVTWSDARNSLNGSDIYAHHVLASGALDPAWPENGTTVCSITGVQNGPTIVSDGAGGAFVAWADGRAGTTVNDIDLFAQHVLASGQVDPAWPANGTAVCTAPKAQVSPVMVEDGVGGVIVTWTDVRSGNPGTDIFAQHVLSSGVVDPTWPTNGLGLCTASGTQSAPKIVSDGGVANGAGSGAIVTWTDTRDGTNEVFAQRVLISGAIASGWPADGRFVSIGGIDEVLPTLVSDGASGAIVAWSGGGSGHHNIRAQHLVASGVLDPAWPVGGRSLSFAPSEETNQVVVSDGAGGAIVAWQVSQDIEAQHVLASSALDAAFPVNGRLLCALPSAQHEPDMVASGPGGAIVTWMDGRDDIDDIYALQVLAAGTVGVPDPTAPAEIAFARPSPNPAREGTSLRFALPREAHVKLSIYSAAGRRVCELVSGAQPAGEHSITWDLRDSAGRAVGAGLYFARLEADGQVIVQKVAALR